MRPKIMRRNSGRTVFCSILDNQKDLLFMGIYFIDMIGIIFSCRPATTKGCLSFI